MGRKLTQEEHNIYAFKICFRKLGRVSIKTQNLYSELFELWHNSVVYELLWELTEDNCFHLV